MNRRDFLKGATLTSLGAAFVMEELRVCADEATRTPDKPSGPPVNCAVVGLGPQGREILASLAKLGNAPVVAVCDTYTAPAYLKRATEIAPRAAVHADYRKLLEQKDVQAVFVATPSHLHKQIVLDALAAGKHVYCEAPLATDIAEAREIAKAGASAKTIFQAGLQNRANQMHRHVLTFMRSGVLGHAAGARGQWHKKTSWRRAAPTPERERELNWRLFQATSSGLPGEVGIHPFDVANWFFNTLPISVIGFGATHHWTQDGMEVPDTVHCILEYPNNVLFSYEATLVSSFEGEYQVFLGSDTSLLIRDLRAWMFKETDSPLLGWEVYARKEKLAAGEDTLGVGIALVADATKLIAQGKEPGKIGADVTQSALYQALRAFTESIRTNKPPVAGPLEGLQATVVARTAHDAVMSGNKIAFQKEWFNL